MKSLKFNLLAFSLLVVICTPIHSFAQSTSSWIHIVGLDSSGELIDYKKSPKIKQGLSYLSLDLAKVHVYHKNNLISLFETGKQSFGRYDVSFDMNNVRIESSRISKPISLKSFNPNKDFEIDLPLASPVASNLPATFSSFNMTFVVTKTARNGLSEMLDLVSTITGSAPALTLAPEAQVTVKATKIISDAFTKDSLNEDKAVGTINIKIDSKGTPSGFAVVFAGKDQRDYAKYENNRDKLKWDGAVLKFDEKPVEKVTYFVFELKELSSLYGGDIDAALSSGRTWAKLYLKGQRKVSTLRGRSDFDRVKSEINTIFDEARLLLDEDISLLNSEKRAIHTKVDTDTLAELGRIRDSYPAE